jgi:hypothetical protein
MATYLLYRRFGSTSCVHSQEKMTSPLQNDNAKAHGVTSMRKWTSQTLPTKSLAFQLIVQPLSKAYGTQHIHVIVHACSTYIGAYVRASSTTQQLAQRFTVEVQQHAQRFTVVATAVVQTPRNTPLYMFMSQRIQATTFTPKDTKQYMSIALPV